MVGLGLRSSPDRREEAPLEAPWCGVIMKLQITGNEGTLALYGLDIFPGDSK